MCVIRLPRTPSMALTNDPAPWEIINDSQNQPLFPCLLLSSLPGVLVARIGRVAVRLLTGSKEPGGSDLGALR